jgi:hypothetical protein
MNDNVFWVAVFVYPEVEVGKWSKLLKIVDDLYFIFDSKIAIF